MWLPSSSLGAPPVGPEAPTTNVYTAGNNRNANSTYDAAGNLTVFGSVSLAYDAENRQKTAGANSYAYDGAGQRVAKATATGTTVYVHDAFGQLAAEYSTAVVTNLCKTCYLSTDHLGSTRLVTDQSGNVVARHDYAPFGQEIPAGVNGRTSVWGASDNVNQKFTGYERDTETALDFAQARDMSAGLGRFLSPDPGNAGADFTNPQSWNGYAYVLGNPLRMVDRSGRCAYTGPVGGDINDPNNYTDDDGVQSCADAFGGGTPISTNTTANVSQTPTTQDDVDFFKLWSSGQGPASINYGPNDGMTKQLANTATFNKIRQQYIQQGCPNNFGPQGSNHLTPFIEGYGTGNAALMQVGGFSAYGSTSGNATTFTISNIAGQASFSGATTIGPTAATALPYAVGLVNTPLGIALSALSANGVSDNPYGPTGPSHNITQTFTWTESNPCKRGG